MYEINRRTDRTNIETTDQKMKIGIVGSRGFSDYALLCQELEFFDLFYGPITQIVSGGAIGADSLGARWAQEKSIELIVYKPDWKKYKKKAGMIRNTDIVKNSDFVFAFWDGKSKGTKDSIDKSKNLNIPIKVIRY